VLASKLGDPACGACLDYLRRLDEMQIEYSVGCLGMGNAPIADSIESAQALLIDSVWKSGNIAQSAGQDFNSFSSSLKGQLPDFHFSNVVIFCAQSEFSNPDLLEACKVIGSSLSQENIQPIFGITQMTRSGVNYSRSTSTGLAYSAMQWIVDQSSEETTDLPTNYGDFASICGQQQWPAIIIKAISTT
jgi:hypothetical protein